VSLLPALTGAKNSGERVELVLSRSIQVTGIVRECSGAIVVLDTTYTRYTVLTSAIVAIGYLSKAGSDG